MIVFDSFEKINFSGSMNKSVLKSFSIKNSNHQSPTKNRVQHTKMKSCESQRFLSLNQSKTRFENTFLSQIKNRNENIVKINSLFTTPINFHVKIVSLDEVLNLKSNRNSSNNMLSMIKNQSHSISNQLNLLNSRIIPKTYQKYPCYSKNNSPKKFEFKTSINHKKIEKSREIFKKGIQKEISKLKQTITRETPEIINKRIYSAHRTKVCKSESNQLSFKTLDDKFLESKNIISRLSSTLNKLHIDEMKNLPLESDFYLVDKNKFHPNFRTIEGKNPNIEPKFTDIVQQKFKVKREIFSLVNKEIIKQNKITNHNTFERWKRVMIDAAHHFTSLRISIHEFYCRKFPPIKPFQCNESLLLFKAAKEGNIRYVEKLLSENKFIIHDYDYFGQTALHFVVKRNHFKLIKLLVNAGCNVDSEDYFKKTPLYIACKKNYAESVKCLLLEVANPFHRCNNERLDEITSDQIIIRI